MKIKNETTKKLLRLAQNNEKFKDELLGAMRRVSPVRDFAVGEESKAVLLANLKAGDFIRFSFRPQDREPAVAEERSVQFGYDPADRSVELVTEGSGRDLLQDRGGDEGIVYVPSSGPARSVLKIKHVRSVV